MALYSLCRMFASVQGLPGYTPEGTGSAQQGAVTALMCPGAPIDPSGLLNARRSSSSPLSALQAVLLLQGGVMCLKSEIKGQHSSGDVLIKQCLHLSDPDLSTGHQGKESDR